MQVDWGEAIRVAGVGFVTVFVVLIILAYVLYGAARVINRVAAKGSANQAIGKEK